jgi:hypothetical protein
MFLQLMPQFEENGATAGLRYNEQDGELFIENLNKTVSPSQKLTDESSTLDAAMNYIQLGFVWKWLSAIDNLMFGSINLIEGFTMNFFETTDQATYVFGILKGFITLGYVLAAISLWTEKDI